MTQRFKPALISKGLRLNSFLFGDVAVCFKPALISKGLRHCRNCCLSAADTLQASPDLKGIKTSIGVLAVALPRLQASPDLKGIKTPSRRERAGCWPGFKPALISKGLRQGDEKFVLTVAASSQP